MDDFTGKWLTQFKPIANAAGVGDAPNWNLVRTKTDWELAWGEMSLTKSFRALAGSVAACSLCASVAATPMPASTSVSLPLQPGEFNPYTAKAASRHETKLASANIPQATVLIDLDGMPQSEITLDLAPMHSGSGGLYAVPNLPPHIASLPPSPMRVASRLRVNLSPALTSNFDLFLYVSKAAHGPWAQRMYVFRKQTDGQFALLYNWKVSTGREKSEADSQGHMQESMTPAGYYQLDPSRFYANYHSSEWNEPMPHAMFFDWVRNGSKTGLAIHAASGEGVTQIGMRASAGCVRLSPQDAETLFTLVSEHYAGTVPRFAYDRTTQSSSNQGALMRTKDGSLQFGKGYRVLVFIEDFSGDKVATLD